MEKAKFPPMLQKTQHLGIFSLPNFFIINLRRICYIMLYYNRISWYINILTNKQHFLYFSKKHIFWYKKKPQYVFISVWKIQHNWCKWLLLHIKHCKYMLDTLEPWIWRVFLNLNITNGYIFLFIDCYTIKMATGQSVIQKTLNNKEFLSYIFHGFWFFTTFCMGEIFVKQNLHT